MKGKLTSKDPFDLLDELIPPKMPTRKVTEKEWKELTKGMHVDLD